MPELSRFQGMVIKMLFNDTTSHTSMFHMESIRLLLVLTVNFSLVHCLKNNLKCWLDG